MSILRLRSCRISHTPTEMSPNQPFPFNDVLAQSPRALQDYHLVRTAIQGAYSV